MKYLTRSLCCLAVLLSACAGPGYFEPIQPVGDNEAVLYIYRPRADNPGLQPLRFSYPDLLINEESIGVLSFNSHRSLRLESGEYTLTATGLSKISNWEPRDRNLTFKLEPGEIKYVKLNIRYDKKNMNLGQPGAKYLIFLTPTDAKDAVYEIRDTDEE